MRVHFVSGLPRSGTTLLAAILRQNTKFHASMSSPLYGIFAGLCRSMSGANEYARFISDDQRLRVLVSVVDAYYAHLSQERLIFDTNRDWTKMLPALAKLFPTARMICCVRNPAWILDSIERLIQANSIQPSRMFDHNIADVYARAETLVNSGFVGTALSGLRQAWFGEHARRLIAVRYDSLCQNPTKTIGQLYELLGEEPFDHDFNHVEYAEESFDAWIGLPGLHTVAPRVTRRYRQTVLPPDLFHRHDNAFWDVQGQNPGGVSII
jgi:sulfotransferase